MPFLKKLAFSILCSLSLNAIAYDGPDPDEGGIGGTGNIDEPSTERPELIERPERPERIEHVERPDFDNERPLAIEDMTDSGNEMTTGDVERPE